MNLLPSRILFSLVLLLFSFSLLEAQNSKVLHYTETSGYDHGTRANSLSMFNSFPNLQVVNDLNGSSFDTLSSLLNYDLIVFSNTSGSNLLDSLQRANFEAYIQAGGNLLGIHAATDTYRHSTANGSPSGIWDFYAQTLGGSVQQSPNHVAGTPLYQMNHLMTHPSLDSIPDPWGKNEEYYYWENGFLDSSINVILEVEQTVGPNNQVNSYDSARAVSWYKLMNTGSRIFYTSLGHANSNFTSNSLFMRHVRQATMWCLGRSTALIERKDEQANFSFYPNPALKSIWIDHDASNAEFSIYDLQGKLHKRQRLSNQLEEFSLKGLENGIYLIEYRSKDSRLSKKLIIQ